MVNTVHTYQSILDLCFTASYGPILDHQVTHKIIVACSITCYIMEVFFSEIFHLQENI